MTVPDYFRAEAYQDTYTPSWSPVDLTAHVSGTYAALEPTVMARSDGRCLLYPGKVHSFQGESESGKSMVAQAETARQLAGGNPCLYVDFESDAGTIVDRLLKLGATPAQIAANLHYVNPDTRNDGIPEEAAAWMGLLGTRYTLAILDGVTEAFAVFGVKSIDNDEVTAWGRAIPRRIAASTGAAVVLIDHVTKSTEGRGRFAIGAQAKMSYLTGASYTVEVQQPIGVGMKGRLTLRVGKDRPGQVRPISGEWRKSDRTQAAAVAVIDSTDPERIAYGLYPADEQPSEYDAQGILMERISEALETAGKPLTFRGIKAAVNGRENAIRDAISELARAGHISVTPGPRNSFNHTFISPYGKAATNDLEF